MKRLLLLSAIAAACRSSPALPERGALNAKPFADAGIGSTYRLGATVTLDGTGSFDPDGEIVRYEWAVTTRPPGSTALPLDANASMTTFVPDVFGTYQLRLVVTDEGGATDVSQVSFQTIGQLVVDAGEDRTIPWFRSTQLGGSVTAIAGAPTTYEWRIESAPAGSSATLSDTATLTPSLFADADGEYVIALIGKTSGEELIDRVHLTTTVTGTAIAPGVVDYVNTRIGNRLIYATSAGAVVLFDPSLGTTSSIASGLTAPVRSMSYHSSFEKVVVGGGREVSVINVTPLSVDVPTTVPIEVADVMAGNDMRVHCLPADGLVDPLVSLDLFANEIVTTPSPGRFLEGVGIGWDWVVVQRGSPHVVVYDTTTNPISIAREADLPGVAAPLFPSENGRWFVTGNGFVVSDQLVVQADLAASVTAAAHGFTRHEVVVATDTQLLLLDDSAFAVKKAVPLPKFGGVVMHPRFLTYDRNERALFVITTTANGDVLVTTELP